MRDVPESAERLLAGRPDDAVVREQYLDFFKNRMFRQTLLCHGEVSGSASAGRRRAGAAVRCRRRRGWTSDLGRGGDARHAARASR